MSSKIERYIAKPSEPSAHWAGQTERALDQVFKVESNREISPREARLVAGQVARRGILCRTPPRHSFTANIEGQDENPQNGRDSKLSGDMSRDKGVQRSGSPVTVVRVDREGQVATRFSTFHQAQHAKAACPRARYRPQQAIKAANEERKNRFNREAMAVKEPEPKRRPYRTL